MKKLLKLFPVLGITLIACLFIGCSDDDDDKSSEASILEMTFESPIVTRQPVIEGTNIKFYVAYNATDEDLKELVPTISISPKATVDPASGSKVDFSGDPVKFTVIAENGSTKFTYTVSYTRSANAQAEILKMTFSDPVVVKQPVVDGTNVIFYVKGTALGTDLEKLVPTIEISENATINPASGSEIDFSEGLAKFTVTAGDGETETIYTAFCVKSTNTESSMLKMTFDNPIVTGQPVIDGNNILFHISGDAVLSDLEKLIPTIELPEKATVSPASGSEVDFSTGTAEFTVTGGDGTTKTVYKVIMWQNKIGFEDWVVVNPGSKVEYQHSKPILGNWSTCNVPLPLMMQLGKHVDKMSVTKAEAAESHTGTGAARIETLGTPGTSATYPKVVAGTLFTGDFKTDPKNTLKSTLFGIPYNKKPKSVKGYYKYTPGEAFHRCPDKTKYNITVVETETTDQCAINAILYEINSDDDPYLTGEDAYTAVDRLVARAELTDGSAKSEYTEFNLNFEYKYDKTYDPAKKYRLAIICASSKWGDTFSGAPGSVLYIDDIELISE